ncbi:MAG: hypothetical protein RLZZ381_1083 [Cyanobacteriota bacterium]|jgi:hypothetical protein
MINKQTDIDQDYVAWLEEQVNKLKNHNFEQLDLDNLVEELEALVRNERSAVKSFTYQIIVHLLLIQYWTGESQRNKNHWQAQIDNFQFQLSDKMTTNFKNFLHDELPKIYLKARKAAIDQTGLNSDRFPETSPYSLDEIIGMD